MRKIKFRGKSIVSGEWVEGDLIHATNADNQEEAWIITDDYSGDVITFGTCQSPKVDLETIGQYTGLKDRNGVEIYEGDILLDGDDLYIVKYCDNEGMFILEDSDIIENFSNINSKWLEVIGDIYDELLKESD